MSNLNDFENKDEAEDAFLKELEAEAEANDACLKDILGIDDETLTELRAWLDDCWEKGENPDYDQIGKWICDYINNEKKKEIKPQ